MRDRILNWLLKKFGLIPSWVPDWLSRWIIGKKVNKQLTDFHQWLYQECNPPRTNVTTKPQSKPDHRSDKEKNRVL